MLAAVSNACRSRLRLKAAAAALALGCGLTLAGISFGQVRETVVQVTDRPAASSADPTASFAWRVGPRRESSSVCSLDGGEAVACVSPWRYTGLGAGRHRFTVTAFDEAGAALGSASFSWTIERRHV